MEEIKVGEYVRDKDGCIIKVKEIQDYSAEDDYWYEEKILKGIWKSMVVKHSPNIIDLVQEGDYVNGSKVIDIIEAPFRAVYTENQEQKLALIPIINEQIKNVVTHEQFNQVKYEV